MALPDDPVVAFKSAKLWAQWLNKNHRTSTGIWMKIAKKGATAPSVSYAEALGEALCYGWIDGQKRPFDAENWLQRFVPRTTRSIWSKINREKAAALMATGRMQPAGEEAIAAAKKNGRWEAAYAGSKGATVPEDFQAALDGNAEAKAFFETLDRTNRYAVLWRIQTVKKAETRARKIAQFAEMLARKEKIHP
jgi:uncharacterized protein YdeI (YjbR/CyaY-like superfamily)